MLDELNCKGSYRSLGQVDYAETVRTNDTPNINNRELRE